MLGLTRAPCPPVPGAAGPRARGRLAGSPQPPGRVDAAPPASAHPRVPVSRPVPPRTSVTLGQGPLRGPSSVSSRILGFWGSGLRTWMRRAEFSPGMPPAPPGCPPHLSSSPEPSSPRAGLGCEARCSGRCPVLPAPRPGRALHPARREKGVDVGSRRASPAAPAMGTRAGFSPESGRLRCGLRAPRLGGRAQASGPAWVASPSARPSPHARSLLSLLPAGGAQALRLP